MHIHLISCASAFREGNSLQSLLQDILSSQAVSNKTFNLAARCSLLFLLRQLLVNLNG